MKKISFFTVLIPSFLMLASCGSTGTVAQTADEAVTKTQEEVANAIADEMNAVSPIGTDTENTERSNLDVNETAATSDSDSDADGTNEADEPDTAHTVNADAQGAADETADSDEIPDVGADDSDMGIFAEPTVQLSDSETVETESETDSPSENAADDNFRAKTGDENQSDSAEADTAASDGKPAQSADKADEAELAEKVSDEDSYLSRERENAPMPDERSKVSEYQIFEEPEVVVIDLPEETETAVAEEEPPAESEAVLETAQTEIAVSEPAKAEKSSDSARTDSLARDAISESDRRTAQKPEIFPESKTPGTESPTAQVASAVTDEEPYSEIKAELEADEAESAAPSRSVAVKINQYLDVTYPGKGWTYIGEADKNALFTYFGRKLGTGNTTFSLRAKKAGNTLLHFYKNDALTGEYIDDYLAVTVETKRSAGRVKAPSYADVVPAQPQRRIARANEGASQPAQNQTDQPQAQPSQTETAAQDAQKPQEADSQPTDTQAKPESAQAQNPQTISAQSEGAASSNTPAAPAQAAQAQAEQAPKAQTAATATASTPAQSAQAQRGRTAQLARTASQSANLPSVESDIKTVVQTTEVAGATSPQSIAQAGVAANVSLNARANERAGVQSYDYTPASSESSQAKTSAAESAVQSEPWVVSAERGAKSDGAKADESLLEQAKQDFVDGKFAAALKEAQDYYNNADTRLDEALFLLGQISESNSPAKDIRFAVDSYDMLVRRFPQSKLWKDAKNRSIYLKRFYIDIR